MLLYALAQTMTWFQMNAQFKWPWLQNHHWLLTLFSFPIGYIFIKGVGGSGGLYIGSSPATSAIIAETVISLGVRLEGS